MSSLQDTYRPSHTIAWVILAFVCYALPWSVLAATLPLPANGQPALRIHGSNTIGAQLSLLMVRGFLKEQGFERVVSQNGLQENERLVIGTRADGKSVRIEMAAHGSSTGFQGLISGEADIAAASRPIKSSEALKLESLGDSRGAGSEHVIGIDGIAIIVNPANPLASLSTEDLARVFSGDIQDWKALQGPAGPIHLYARDDRSGTFDTFKELVMASSGKSLAATAERFESNDALSAAILKDPNGIGFVGLAAIGKAKTLTVSDGQALPLAPTTNTIATEDYPLSRRLFFYTRPLETNPWVKALVSYAQSPAGQQWVNLSGFVAQEIMAVRPVVPSNAPDSYQALTTSAQRLSVNFRFAEGSATLDNKANRDIQRLLDYLKQNDKLDKKVTLIGFSDTKENLKRAELLSKLRAMAVRRELNKGGVIFHDIVGLGEALPVASNASNNRLKNRRVEVWVH